jgi:hypothetical protein
MLLVLVKLSLLVSVMQSRLVFVKLSRLVSVMLLVFVVQSRLVFVKLLVSVKLSLLVSVMQSRLLFVKLSLLVFVKLSRLVFVMLSVRKVGNGSEWETDSDLVMADSHTRERRLDSDSHSHNMFQCNHLREASPSHHHLPHT